MTWLNHEKMGRVAEVVQRCQGRRVGVRVWRGVVGGREGEGVDVEVGLVPRSGWGGRGLLGCHLLPL